MIGYAFAYIIKNIEFTIIFNKTSVNEGKHKHVWIAAQLQQINHNEK